MLRYHLRSVSILILFILFLVSCERSETHSPGKKPRNENTLRYDVSAPFTSLNPTEVELSGSTIVFPLLYSYLFVPNGNGKLEPDLAFKWTYDPKNFSWTIHLKKDAMFHNKQPVTSKDVKYSLEEVFENIRPSLFSLIDRISPLSDTIISIGLKRNDPELLQKIWDFEIVPKFNGSEIDYYNHPIGSGPFRFKYRKGEKEVVLEANEDYFNGKPCLDRIVFYFQQDKEKAWTRLLSGETDIAQEISPKNYEMMRQYEKRYYFDLYPLSWYAILLYNTTDPLFSDPKVRLALSHAIDREYIVKTILRGLGKVAVGPMGVDSPYHNPEVKPIPYDPQKGLELLKEAGWFYDNQGRYLHKQRKLFEFTILVFEESQIEKKVAQYLQLCLNDLGIKVRLQLLHFKELERRYLRNNEFQAVLTEFRGVSREPKCLRGLWCPDSRKRSKAGSFEHPEVTHLICQALDEKDPSKRKELFYQIDALITSLQPGTFLFHKTAIDVMSKRFKLPFPFSLTHEGIYRLRYASLKKDRPFGP
ncbi:MAG: ABC transporter substrate-binding protein [Desulfobacterales bacterium]|nr:ABC transporter substrate-binding protein [Desulfobacterales bacterium]